MRMPVHMGYVNLASNIAWSFTYVNANYSSSSELSKGETWLKCLTCSNCYLVSFAQGESIDLSWGFSLQFIRKHSDNGEWQFSCARGWCASLLWTICTFQKVKWLDTCAVWLAEWYVVYREPDDCILFVFNGICSSWKRRHMPWWNLQGFSKEKSNDEESMETQKGLCRQLQSAKFGWQTIEMCPSACSHKLSAQSYACMFVKELCTINYVSLSVKRVPWLKSIHAYENEAFISPQSFVSLTHTAGRCGKRSKPEGPGTHCGGWQPWILEGVLRCIEPWPVVCELLCEIFTSHRACREGF